MAFQESDERGSAVLRAAFRLAHTSGGPLRPEYILVAIAEGDGAAAEALQCSVPGGIRSVAFGDWGSAHGSPIAFHMQVQGAANDWSLGRGEDTTPEHLLVALIDQGNPGVVRALGAAHLDATVVRRRVLEAMGASPNTDPIAMPLFTAAGCGDRPPLPVDELPQDVWTALQQRQERLPLRRLHRRWHSGSLYHVERRAAWRLASRHGADLDQCHSLVHHHNHEVQRRMADAAPDLVQVHHPRSWTGGAPVPVLMRKRTWRTQTLRWMFSGWGCWFQNRVVSIRTAWFKATTLHYYWRKPKHVVGQL